MTAIGQEIRLELVFFIQCRQVRVRLWALAVLGNVLPRGLCYMNIGSSA